MRAVVMRGPRDLAVETVEDPTPGDGQLVLRVRRAGVCGTDLSMWKLGAFPPGTILGHEFCGEVMETAHGFAAGQRVCALPMLSCGVCPRCKSGLGAFCENQGTIGMGSAMGALAEYVTVAAHESVRLPEGVDDTGGGMVEPLAVSLHAMRAARLRSGSTCLILGAGPVGLGLILWARHFGAREVIVSEPSAERRKTAEAIGATTTIEPEALPELLAARDAAPDAVVEAAGAPGLIQKALEAVSFRGHVVVAGVCMGADPIQPFPAMAKEASLHFVLAYEKDDFQYTVDMLDSERVDPLPMLTEEVGLDDIPATFEALERGEKCKVLCRP